MKRAASRPRASSAASSNAPRGPQLAAITCRCAGDIPLGALSAASGGDHRPAAGGMHLPVRRPIRGPGRQARRAVRAPGHQERRDRPRPLGSQLVTLPCHRAGGVPLGASSAAASSAADRRRPSVRGWRRLSPAVGGHYLQVRGWCPSRRRERGEQLAASGVPLGPQLTASNAASGGAIVGLQLAAATCRCAGGIQLGASSAATSSATSDRRVPAPTSARRWGDHQPVRPAESRYRPAVPTAGSAAARPAARQHYCGRYAPCVAGCKPATL